MAAFAWFKAAVGAPHEICVSNNRGVRRMSNEKPGDDRLKAENSYLLTRMIETEARLNGTLENLTQALSQLSKAVMPVKQPKFLTVEEAAGLLNVKPSAI